MAQKKKWPPAVKFKIALEAIKSETTINDISRRYQVAPSQIHAWKKQLLEDGSQMFESHKKSSKQQAKQSHEKLQQQLYEKIGELTVERDYLKKTWEKFQGESDDY